MLDELLVDLEEGNLNEKEVEYAKKYTTKEFKNGIPACGADALRMALAAYTQQVIT